MPSADKTYTTHGEADAYLIDADTMRKLRELEQRLQGGSDRERDHGHKLWYLLNQAVRSSATTS